MIQDPEARTIEQVVREKQEAQETVNRLYAEAKRISYSLSGELGATMRTSPEMLVFESQIATVNFRYYTPRGKNSRVYKDEEVSQKAIALTDEIRAALLRVAALTEEEKRLAF